MADELKIQIVLDDGSIKTGFFNLEKQAKKSSDSVEDSLGGAVGAISSKLKALGAVLAAAFTVNKLVNFLKDSAEAASEAERATNALSASLANIGKFSNEAVAGFDEFAKNLQRTTGIEDDLIKQNAALLVSIGNLSGDGLERGTKAALNLSKALQIDVGTAFDLVSKAAAGNTSQLGRYGIKLDENIPKSQKFAATLELIERRFGGLAETNLNTFGGALANLSNSFSELQESVGVFITQSPVLRAVVNSIAEFFFNLSESVSSFQKTSGDIVGDLIKNIIDFSLAVNEFLFKPLELGFNLLVVGVKTIIAAVQGLIALFAQIPSLVTQYILVPITEAVGFIADKIVGVVNKDLGKNLKDSIVGFGDSVNSVTSTIADSTSSVFEDSFNSLADSAENAFKGRATPAIESFLETLKKSANSAKAIQADYRNSTNENLQAVADKYESVRKQIDAAVQQGIVRTVTTGLQTIGAALIKGGKAFDNFGNVILGLLGDLAIQVGSLLIGMGIGIDSLKTALATFNGGLAIAAGAALIVLGGALKALSGGLGEATAAPAFGGGIAGQPSPTTELTTEQNLTRAEPSTGVQVIIQGDVLDSDESGSRIVDLINQAFDKKGVVVNQGVFA